METSNTPDIQLVSPLSSNTLPSTCCPACGQQKADTLSNKIHDLIERYGFIEFLERLADLTHNQAQLESDSAVEKLWNSLVKQLETATDQAVAIACAKPDGSENWR